MDISSIESNEKNSESGNENLKKRIILTGATGFIGEGVLFECLARDEIEQVLIITRKHYDGKPHPKLRECIVPDFFNLEEVEEELKGYDGCFYCAGKSSAGMNEKDYTRLTYDMVLYFANKLLSINPQMVFCHVSGASTDSTEKGKIMWARVKGKTENELLKLPFKRVYNFRPAIMKASPGQRYKHGFNKFLHPLLYSLGRLFSSKSICTIQQIGMTMIRCLYEDFPKQILEVADIVSIAQS
jgi:hypothetical protein